MADDTYYSLLEISEASSSAEIKAAYLRLIREVHPDRLANAPAYWQRQAEEKAKEINEAYAALSNRENRQLYDAQLAAYRGSRSTNSGQTTSQPPTPPSPRATQQRSQASSQTQYSSGASSSSSQRPSSASQQRNTASTSAPPTNAASHSTNQSSTPATNAGQRLFLAVLCSLYGIGAGYEFLTETSNGGQALLFLLTMLSFSLCLLIYQTLIRSIFDAIGLSRIRHHVLTSVGVLALVMVAGKVANMNRDTHFRGPNDQSASNAQISQVKIINGRLSDTTVSGNSNEKYPSAYNFSGYIQNNSSAIISFIRIKIRIFDCLDTRSSVSPTSDAIESVFDPSPPSNCKSIGEEEEDDFPHAGPGQTVGFANFYFPNHPQGGLRWNYEITKMDTRSIVSVPAQRTSDVRSPQQPLQDRRAQQIDSKGESEKTTQSQPLLQTARPPGSLDNPQRPLPATTPIGFIWFKRHDSTG